jgi:hypothetical protein
MEAHFSPVAFAVIREAVREHLAALPHAIDSFLEERILASLHYRILVAGETAGFQSIHGEHLITQFALDKPHATPRATDFRRTATTGAGAVRVCADL